MSGKGSSPRPFSVTQEKFGSNFDAIFRKPSPKEIDDAMAEQEEFDRILEDNLKRTKREFDEKVIMKQRLSR